MVDIAGQMCKNINVTKQATDEGKEDDMQVVGLRQLIYAKYDSEAQFARKLGWTRQKLHKITSASKLPSILEAGEIAAGLGVSVDLIATFFAQYRSPKEQPEKEDANA